MERVLITGAAGDIGSRLRVLLKPVYRELVRRDRVQPAELTADENFTAADLADAAAVESLCQG